MSVHSLMTALANAVRSKTGATGKLSIEQMTTSLNSANIHDTTSVTATAGDVLSGKKIVSSTGASVTGTMANNGTVTPSALNCGGSYTIPAGYHNGSGKVTAASLASQTEGTASTFTILTGQTAWVNGNKVTGSMMNRGAVSQSLAAGESYEIPSGYHNGSGKVTAATLASQTDGDATAAQILTGKIAWVDGAKVTGTMADQGAKTSSLDCGGSYTIPAGYHNGSGKITANSLASQTSATATAEEILTGKTAWVNGTLITGTNTSAGYKIITGTVDLGSNTSTSISVTTSLSSVHTVLVYASSFMKKTTPIIFQYDGGIPDWTVTMEGAWETRTAYGLYGTTGSSNSNISSFNRVANFEVTISDGVVTIPAYTTAFPFYARLTYWILGE